MCTLNLGATSQLSDFTSCVGDTFTFNCTVDSLGHTWNIGQHVASILPSTSQDLVLMGLTIRLEDASSTAIVSSVSGTVFAELNNTVIMCRDGLRPAQGEAQQLGTVLVLGKCI